MSSPVFIIAEAGVNHNGDLDTAHALVEAAVLAGVDAVKFQTFRADRLVVRGTEKTDYQKVQTGGEGDQYAMLKALELSESMHRALADQCADCGIEFMSTGFDVESVSYLVRKMSLQRIKIPSGEVTNGPYLLAVARLGLPVILSTGMSTLDDVCRALNVIAFGMENPIGDPSMAVINASRRFDSFSDRIAVLHCTSEYPTPYRDVNLRAMDTMAEAFGLPIGLSDHTLGIHVAVAATARGACIVEKHLTLDRSLPGPDHAASLEPHELASMVSAVRDIEASMGDGVKVPAPSEVANVAIVRRSIVAARDIAEGEILSQENLDLKRPGTGRSPLDWWQVVGSHAKRPLRADETFDP